MTSKQPSSESPTTSSRIFSSAWFLPATMVLAGLLRWALSARRGLTYDDTFSFFLAEQPLAKIVSGTAADTMPPLYYFLLHFWMLLGKSVWLLRSLNIILSIVTIALLYYWVRELAGQPAASWAALIAAVSPLHVYHAQDMRMYALLAFGQLGYAICATRLITRGARAMTLLWWVGLVFAGALAMYTHNLAGAVLLVPNLILLVQRRWRDLKKLTAAQALVGLIALPWLLLVPGQIAKIQTAFWTPQPGLVEVIQAVVLFHSQLPLPGAWMAAAVLFSLQAAALVAFEILRSKLRGGVSRGVGLLAAFLVAPPVVLFLVSYLMRPVFVTRAFIFCSLPYFGLAGIALSRLRVTAVRIYLAGSFAALAVLGLSSVYWFDEFPRSPFQDMTTALQTEAGPDRLVLHDNKLSFFPARFYAPGLHQEFLVDEPGSPNDTLALASQEAMQIFPLADLEGAAAGYETIYYVVFQQALDEYQASSQEPPALLWLRSHFHPGSPRAFGDIWVYPFRSAPER